MFDIYRFTQTFRIALAPSGHKHARRGWVNMICPFHKSDTPGYHLGFNLERGYFVCWSCGWHPLDETISSLGKIPKDAARKLSREYYIVGIEPERDRVVVRSERIVWPPGYGPMDQRHKSYLTSRMFDPDRLAEQWGLMGTSNWGHYMFRVVAPIIFRGEVVSWQARDVTGKQSSKYLPCPQEDEIFPHKFVLYGLDQARWPTVMIVEGITGVWRLGPGAVATFGVEYTWSQIRLMQHHFKAVRILYDGDSAGQNSAEQLASRLAGRDMDVEILDPIDCDSGDMPQSLADQLMKEVRG